jgi:hypothetical protein
MGRKSLYIKLYEVTPLKFKVDIAIYALMAVVGPLVQRGRQIFAMFERMEQRDYMDTQKDNAWRNRQIKCEMRRGELR